MTREEAIKIANKHGFNASASDWIGLFAELGVLKLDEPPKYSKQTMATVQECRALYTSAAEFLEGLENHGLKIVEK